MSHPAPALIPLPSRSCAPSLGDDVVSVVRHLSHELRQPLSTLEGTAYYLGIALPRADARVRQHVERLQQQIHQVNWILSDALHYLQAVPPRPGLIDLEELLSQCAMDLTPSGRAQLDLDLSAPGKLVLFDPGQGQHMLRNLLRVFRQICRASDAICVTTRSGGGYVALTVSCRAPAELLEDPAALFEPFAPHLPSGSGLALASVRSIAESQGGTVSVEAAEPGQLEVTVRLPLAGCGS